MFLSLVVVAVLTACGGTDDVSMRTIDNYLNQEDTVYIDLRNDDEIAVSGHIDGFSVLSYEEMLVGGGLLAPTPDFVFRNSDILDADALRVLFPQDETIILMCRSGRRSAYVLRVLEALGYETVYDAGGIIYYRGDYLIAGMPD